MARNPAFDGWLKDFFTAFGIAVNPPILRLWEDTLGEYPVEALRDATRAFSKTIQRGGGAILPGALVPFLPSLSGHPLPEIAWNHLPKSDFDGGYVTDQMMSALADCHDSLMRGDFIAGRKAFLESYAARVRAAEAQGLRAVFFYSQPAEGSREQRLALKETKTIEALKNGWLTHEKAKKTLSAICDELAKPLPLALERISGLVTGLKMPAETTSKQIENKSAQTLAPKLDLIEAYGEIKAKREAEEAAARAAEADRQAQLNSRRRMLLAQSAAILGGNREAACQ